MGSSSTICYPGFKMFLAIHNFASINWYQSLGFLKNPSSSILFFVEEFFLKIFGYILLFFLFCQTVSCVLFIVFILVLFFSLFCSCSILPCLKSMLSLIILGIYLVVLCVLISFFVFSLCFLCSTVVLDCCESRILGPYDLLDFFHLFYLLS